MKLRNDLRSSLKLFKALADANRLRAAALLVYAGRELCVCELTDAMRESQYNVSRCLGALCSAGFVKKRKVGRWVMYSLAENVGLPKKLIEKLIWPAPCCAGVSEDISRLKKRLSLRRKGVCVKGRGC